MAQAVERFPAQQLAKKQATEQPEKMGAKICPFTRAPQHSQKRHTGHEGDKKMTAGKIFSALVSEDGQHADDGKHRSRKADVLMFMAANEGVDQVAATGGEKHGRESKAGAGQSAEKMNEPAADEAVSQQVDGVGVQGKRGQQAPPFAVQENAPAVTSALGKPEGVIFPGAGDGEKKDQSTDQEQSRGLQQRDKVVVGWRRGRGPVFILGEVAFQFMDCPQLRGTCHQKLPGVVVMVNVVRNLDR